MWKTFFGLSLACKIVGYYNDVQRHNRADFSNALFLTVCDCRRSNVLKGNTDCNLTTHYGSQRKHQAKLVKAMTSTSSISQRFHR